MEKFSKVFNAFRIIGVAAAFALSAGTGLAYANLDFTSINDTTGSHSRNISEVQKDMDLDIDIDDSSDLDNDFDLDVETGNNDFSGNTIAEDATTGDVDVSVEFDNGLNGDDIFGNGGGLFADFGELSVEAGNAITGYNSINENFISINRDLDIDIDNDSDINNDIDFRANTGNNDVSYNTEVGDVSTGDISFSSDITNETNSGIGSLSGLLSAGSNDMSVDFSNDTTGYNSENINEINADSDIDLDVDNNSDINNDYQIDANTGNNDVSCNTIVGDISTGSIDISISGTNISN